MTEPADIEQTLRYVIDAEDRIIKLDGNWDPMFSDGERETLPRDSILGQPMWNFILNDGLRSLYAVLIKRVRQSRRTIRFPYRCDTPDRRRLARLKLKPGEAGQVHFISDILTSEQRLVPLTLDYVPGNRGLVRSCSICSRLDVAQNWQHAEELSEQQLGVVSENSLRVAHGICPDCSDSVSKLGTDAASDGVSSILGRAWQDENNGGGDGQDPGGFLRGSRYH